jgi:mitochondrial fission protein ELM1
VIICPEHDGLEANNLIQMQGSIHQFNQKRLNQLKEKWMSMFGLNKDNVLSIFIGNPGRAFFNSIESLSLKIIRHYPNYNVYISASRRTPDKYKKQLANHFNFAKLVWFSELDGDNPYLGMLSCSDILIVTADSINMVSEAVATNKPVVIVGIDCVSPKHKRFIKSLNNRVIHLGEKTADTYLPINSLSKVGVQVIDLLNDK